MWLKRIQKWIPIQLVMAFDTDLNGAVAGRARDTEDHVAVVDLTIVESDLGALIDVSGDQLGGTRDAAAVFATVRQVNALLAQAVQQWSASVDLVSCAIAIGQCDDVGRHSQISLVQSPPG